MALINCLECGREISDKAAACPHCGCPVNEQIQNGPIHFYWVGKKGDSIRKTTIFIDGKEFDAMNCGDCLDILVTAGDHVIDLYQKKHHLLEETVTICNQNPEEYFAFKEAPGFTHANIKRIEANSIKQWPQPKKNVPRCPTCGSEKIKKLSLTKKVFAFEMVGFASNSIGKTFECKKCGYKW